MAIIAKYLSRISTQICSNIQPKSQPSQAQPASQVVKPSQAEPAQPSQYPAETKYPTGCISQWS